MLFELSILSTIYIIQFEITLNFDVFQGVEVLNQFLPLLGSDMHVDHSS